MIFLPILAGFGTAIAAPWLTRKLRSATGWILAIVPLSLTIYFIFLVSETAGGRSQAVSFPWSEALYLRFSFQADGLGLLFALLISGIGTLITIYAGGYLKGHSDLGRFYAWLMTFMSAMLGVVLADNLLVLFIFWELTSLSSFMLIGFKHEYESSRTAALQALLVTGMGGLVMLAGLILLGISAGTLELSALVARSGEIQSSVYYYPALICILVGAFSKSAQFPFHFWLPNAMEAPTPVSAYLHSATMVKAGLYLLARLTPVLGGTPAWELSVTAAGMATMLVGSYLAIRQTDLKKLLAYSTIAALGTITFLLGIGHPTAIKAAMTFLLAHALYKGALFMIAGSIDHEAGTRDVTRLSGLARLMPVTAAAAVLAGLSMAGTPPFFGFIAKELLYEVSLEAGWWAMAGTVFTALSGIFVAGVVAVIPFWSGKRNTDHETPIHEAPPSMWIGPFVLAGLGILSGFFPGLAASWLVGPSTSASSGELVKVKLALWHGINPALIYSLATLLAGIAAIGIHKQIRLAMTNFPGMFGPERFYHAGLNFMNTVARWQTRILQNGYLRHYMTTIVLTTVGMVTFTLIYRRGWHWPENILDLQFHEVALAGLILIASFAAARSSSRLAAVAALGAVGYGVALIYLIYGAPDLAMTQFLIESLTVILFVLAFYHLPRFTQLTSSRERIRDLTVAGLAGVMMTLLVLSSLGGRLFPPISEFYAFSSLPIAHGRNIVNVILVDFRSIDTLGEITVLAIAAIGVLALLRVQTKTDKKGGSK